MAVVATTQMTQIYVKVKPYLKSMKRGGIAAAKTGYHDSIENIKKRGAYGRDYSTIAPADRRGKAQHAAAIDLTFGTLADQITASKRLKAACNGEKAGYDPRVEPMREWIGSLDGKRVCGDNRYPSGTGNRARTGYVSSGFGDSSHLWHVHISLFRDYADDLNACLGVAEVVAGVRRGAFGWKDPSVVTTVKPKPAPAPPSVTPKVSLKAVQAAVTAGVLVPDSKDDVLLIEGALDRADLVQPWYVDGVFGEPTRKAYAAWQRSLGYTGTDADGVPGETSLKALGAKYGFKVVA